MKLELAIETSEFFRNVEQLYSLHVCFGIALKKKKTVS